MAASLALGLGGCGLSDHFSVMPAFLRYDAPQAREVPYPDVLAMAKTQGRRLFAHAPGHIEISTPLYSVQSRIYAVCARVDDGSGHPLMFAHIIGTSFADRRRAETADGCEGLDFTPVDVD